MFQIYKMYKVLKLGPYFMDRFVLSILINKTLILKSRYRKRIEMDMFDRNMGSEGREVVWLQKKCKVVFDYNS